MATLIEKRTRGRAQRLTEDLNGVELEMVLIPAGSFDMGAPAEELESKESERPQHSVTVPQLLMGKYQVTQAQWRAVASMPQVNRDLKVDPSRFKGANRPVEQVSWHDAVEFCDRLSVHTNRRYRLPSEAEWEYACRAGTKTPFHFGETISSKYANYDGVRVYGDGVRGEDRGETTDAGSFRVANNFGLFDMHGNVWEWCGDHWHENYINAPEDGRTWVAGGDSERRVLRGGSWGVSPDLCRSAYRLSLISTYAGNRIGFRVVCSAFSTLNRS